MIDSTLAGKTQIPFDDIKDNPPKSYMGYYFASENKDKSKGENKDKCELECACVDNATFANMSFKGARFSNVNFSHSTFNNCYFRQAQFYNCNFTGCKFEDCNFTEATMASCDLKYSLWRKTAISRGLVLTNLPPHENEAQALLINLRINAMSIGEYVDAKVYVYESEKQSRRHNLKKFKSNEDYYRKKHYTMDERLIALMQYFRSYIERLFWGYGENLMNLVATAFLIILAFAIFYFIRGSAYSLNEVGVVGGFVSSFKLSLAVFTGFNLINVDNSARTHLYNWFLLEAPFGLIFISFLAASLHRKISTRRD